VAEGTRRSYLSLLLGTRQVFGAAPAVRCVFPNTISRLMTFHTKRSAAEGISDGNIRGSSTVPRLTVDSPSSEKIIILRLHTVICNGCPDHRDWAACCMTKVSVGRATPHVL
jgi:hypothetical protein